MDKLPKGVNDAAFNRSLAQGEAPVFWSPLTLRQRVAGFIGGVWIIAFPLAVLGLLAFLLLR